MNVRSFLCLFVIIASLIGCEHIDFAKDEETNASSINTPTSTGKGTVESPYTISDIHTNASSLSGQQVWIIGYAVGDAYRSLSTTTFSPPFEHTSSVLLADNPQCSEATQCLPVELSTDTQKSALALANNPQLHLQALLIQGTLQSYYRTLGLRDITSYHWFPNYTIPNLTPTDWDEEQLSY